MNESNQTHSTVTIIGGGCVGIAALRDLSLHNIDATLFNKGDFISQTSSRSSKMLHGGVRYLENFDLELVSEALHEKNLWVKLAPHLCKELPFCIPIYKESKYPLWQLSIGLKAYDFLSSYENSPHQILNRTKTINKYNYLKKNNLKGSGVYFDAIMNDHLLAFECLLDALINKQIKAHNYHELIHLEKVHNNYKLTFLNELTNEKHIHITKHIIFSLGPFTDQVLQKLNYFTWNPRVLPSKGTHIWVSRNDLPIDTPFVLQTNDDRIIFLIPHSEQVLIGTTEKLLNENEKIFDIKATEDEIDYLINNVNNYFLGFNLSKNKVSHAFAGVRPLVIEGTHQENTFNTSKVSREHKEFLPEKNISVIVGGKYTTFRIMPQKIVERVCLQEGIAYNKNLTTQPLRKKSIYSENRRDLSNFENIKKIITTEKVKKFSDLIERRLFLNQYGNDNLSIDMEKLKTSIKNEFSLETLGEGFF